MMRRAEQLVLEEGTDVSCFHGFAHCLPFNDAYLDVVTSSFFFQHLTLARKIQTLREIALVLRPEGVLLILEWVKPLNWFNRLSFLTVRCLDGFGPIKENVEGVLPSLIESAGFANVRVVHKFMAPLGNLALISPTGVTD
jgi:ubiquinone/menaquinone biosynthesis C-methylase UbiE